VSNPDSLADWVGDADVVQAAEELTASAQEAGEAFESDVAGTWQDGLTATGDAVATGQSHVVSTVAHGAASTMLVFSDIEAMATLVRENTEQMTALLGQVGRVAVDGDLLESAILSPGTAAVAGGALTAVAGHITLHIATSNGVAIITAAVVTTYQLADQALAIGAAGLFSTVNVVGTFANGVVQTTVAGVAWTTTHGVEVLGDAGALVVEATELTVALTATLTTLAAALPVIIGTITVELLPLVGQAFWDAALQTIAENPWALLFPPAFLGMTLAATPGQLDAGEVWEAIAAGTQNGIGMIGPLFPVLVEELVWLADELGWEDTATWIGEGSIDDLTWDGAEEQRLENFAEGAAEAFGSDVVGEGNIQPDSLTELILSMGQVDAIGQGDAAVIRVITYDGPPPSFVLVIPSTQEWIPAGSATPNDILGNLTVFTPEGSALQQMARQSLDAAIAAYEQEHGAISGPPSVVTAGFSQGGIVAGSLAESLGPEYSVDAVVTVGAPIGRFTDIPSTTTVIAYESPQDLVANVEGQENPSTWHTNNENNGGTGPSGAHDAVQYALHADGNPPPAPALETLNGILGSDSDPQVTDYLATR